MSNDKKNIIYTAGDIEKYFSGKLSAGQMYAMEKAALDDPFLAEAMEGYEGMKDKDWKSQLAAVRKQITEAGSEAKIIPMHRSTGSKWWKTAAAVLVIGSGAALTFILTKNKPGEKANPEIAQTVTSIPVSPATKDNTSLPSVTESVKPVTPPATEKAASANGTMAQVNPQVKNNDGLTYKQDDKAQDTIKSTLADIVVSGKANPTVTTSANANAPVYYNNKQVEETAMARDKRAAEQNNNDAEAFKKQSSAAQSKKEQSTNNFFNAQVVAADNSPLPFTNIAIKSENFGTYADVKGNFRLVSADTVLNVEVRSVGYAPRNFLLRSNQPQNKIVLLEDETAIKEKMVIQNKDVSSIKKARRATVLSDSLINAEPADGWDNYNTYVANNIHIPDELTKNEFHGEVELSFDVKANGSITNLRVNKSMGEAYDEAAKRLIMQGPQWKVKKGKRSSASVKVKF
ncbi:MAG: carboxypeptidase-like regulatory domain-containing protein [Ferruginibacter sp.]